MLSELKVKNFAIIDTIHIVFRNGLNIVSGETGAGKSVLLKGLALLMGAKSQSDTVRNGAEQAIIEGAFDLSHRPDIEKKLSEHGFEADDNRLVVRRVISPQGKGRVYINGSLCALNSLRELVAPMIELTGEDIPLIEMTSQHENRTLVSKPYQMDALDHYAGSLGLRREFADKLRQMRELENQLERMTGEARERAQRFDFLIYQRDEIENVELTENEITQIENQVLRLRNSSQVSQFIEMADQALYSGEESSVERLEKIYTKAQEMRQLDAELKQSLAPLHQAKVLIEDVIYDLRRVVDKLDTDPSHLEELETRLSRIRHLQKKYGPQESDILNALTQIRAEIHSLENSDEEIQQLGQRRAQLKAELQQIAQNLTETRKRFTADLAKKIHQELSELNMKGVEFGIEIEPLNEWTAGGADQIEFMIRSSRKDTFKPIAKAASGGELSRILLALKQVVGHSDLPRTYLFDEVDTGVSGETAERVGRKLKSMAKHQQVICVTHLPQVAAFGDAHFSIRKIPQGEGVTMQIRELNQKSRVLEIARLISGEKITRSSREHAEQLLRH